ncbi:MAG: sigma-54 interaction domain-containing protein [Planctomyces sp.]
MSGEAMKEVRAERFQDLLLEMWREACRHIQISESANTFLRMLREQVPLGGVVIHWLDQEHSRVSVASVTPDTVFPAASRLHEDLPEKQFRQLMQWIRQGELVRVDPKQQKSPPFQPIHDLASDTSGLIVAPLCGPHGTLGMFTMVPEKENQLTVKHQDLLMVIQEPLAVALENDRRLHELAVLREAAEADRRSLLARLGRQEMSDVVIGADTGLKLVFERVRQCSRSLVPVLILGETGTGKEVIAREIHHGSGRSSGPFIRVNCGAIPPELIDSQLFGHEKGSFTGAVEARKGWFERADGGTLFLDEIGELPPDAQVRFLRVLQDGFVERVGSASATHVDVRVVAATHRNLAEMVTHRKFREDLWYRIAVFPILIPPLRERLDDIPELIDHFIRKAATRFGLAAVQASASDLKLLLQYEWPGNIRELGAVIDRAVILGEGKTLEIKAAMGTPHTAVTDRSPARNPDSTDSNFPAGSESGLPQTSPRTTVNIPESLDDGMRRQIETALEATRGRIEGANGTAALLRINPHTLRARMRKLGIDWARFRLPRIDQ